MSLIGKATHNFISLITKELQKNKNKKNISEITKYLISLILDKINPYFYTLLIMLIIMFIMNFVQFYYYMKILIKTNKQNIAFTEPSLRVGNSIDLFTINN